MKLTDLSIQVRQRSAWEAIDLGFSFVREHWRALMLPHLLLLILIAIPAWFILPEKYLWLAGLVVWWFKPVMDRLLLHILSRQLFNEPITTAEAFSALPRLIGNTGLLSALTYRRFSFSRSYNLPIWQLEGLRGKERKERQALIHLQGHSNAVWLTIGCFLLEMIISLSLYSSIFMLDPTGLAWEHYKSFFRDGIDLDYEYWITLLGFIVGLSSILFIEPFYVAAGFMLYINRRTQLEAWDIEIAFRNLGERLGHLIKAGSSLLPSLLVIFMTTGIWLATATPSYAQYPESKNEFLAEERLGPEQVKAKIDEVMALEELNNRRKVKTWVAKDNTEKKEQQNTEFSKSFIQLMAVIFKFLLWVGVIVAIIFALIYRQKIIDLLKPARKQQKAHVTPDVLFGLDIRPESLPADIAGTAQQLWQQGHAREALSLLYRGALVVLTQQEQLEIHASHTEGDILKLAKPALAPERLNYLTRLTKLWQTIAYAHRQPSNAEVEPLFTDSNAFQKPTPSLEPVEVSA